VRCETKGAACYAEVFGAQLELWSGPPWLGGAPIGQREALGSVRLLCPLAPSKILGIGRNYGAHAREMGAELPTTPLVFMKPPSALACPSELLHLPKLSQRVDFEGELGVVIGARARRVPREHALDHVFGLIATCDVTARDLQHSDGQWTRAKGFDGFCPVAASVTAGLAPSPLQLTTRVNGQLKQDSSTADMVFGVPELVEFLSHVMTLEPGDLILTGTPEGVGPLSPGDRVAVAIDGLETLSFGVADD
jgi:2-keto-4-pentenoate hydratase/2-oxohepta-3-ene-1,7-dioic acid hydratase in catechol pathway